MGHALLCRFYGLWVVSVDIHGLGGLCHYRGSPTALQRSVIAWGGVLTQGALYVITWSLLGMVGLLPSHFLRQLALVFLGTNLWLMLLNLLPIAPLDGAEAWRLPRLWWQRRRGTSSRARTQRLYERGILAAPDRFPAIKHAVPKDPAILQEVQRLMDEATAASREKSQPPPSPQKEALYPQRTNPRLVHFSWQWPLQKRFGNSTGIDQLIQINARSDAHAVKHVNQVFRG